MGRSLAQASLHPAAGSAPAGGLPRRDRLGRGPRGTPPEPPVPGGGRGCLAAHCLPPECRRRGRPPEAGRPAPPQRTKGGQPGPRGRPAPPKAPAEEGSPHCTHRSAGPGGRRGDHPPDLCAPPGDPFPGDLSGYRPRRPRRRPERWGVHLPPGGPGRWRRRQHRHHHGRLLRREECHPRRAEHLPGHPGGRAMGDQENQFRLQQPRDGRGPAAGEEPHRIRPGLLLCRGIGCCGGTGRCHRRRGL